MNDLIRVKHASKTQPSGTRTLHAVDLHASAGENIAVTGNSGSGKSTLLSCLGMIAPFDSGSSYEFRGRDVSQLRERERDLIRGTQIGFVPQNSWLIGHLTAFENVLLPFLHRRDTTQREARRRTAVALERMGIGHLRKRRPVELSGGERQRVAIARAMVSAPELILADEPTGALDAHTGGEVLTLLRALVQETSVCLITVTHDHAIARAADREYRVESGRVRAVASCER